MFKKIFFLAIVSGLLILQSCSKSQYGLVTANNGLILRAKPTVKSERLAVIPRGTFVLVSDANGPQEFLQKIKANWYEVLYEETSGWVFGAFVKLLNFELSSAYSADTEEFVEVYLYKNNNFEMNVNLCQGIGSISGVYTLEQDESVVECVVTSVDFKGFLGDNVKSFKLKMLNDDRLIYDGNNIGCGPHMNSVFIKFDRLK